MYRIRRNKRNENNKITERENKNTNVRHLPFIGKDC